MLTLKEFKTLYTEGRHEEIIKELFGEDASIFNLALYTKKTGYGGQSFDPLYRLIELSEFLVAQTEGQDQASKAENFNIILESYEF